MGGEGSAEAASSGVMHSANVPRCVGCPRPSGHKDLGPALESPSARAERRGNRDSWIIHSGG